MKTIGFSGGSSLCELGPPMDVQLFFDCISCYCTSEPNRLWNLLTDRLYRRYLRIDQLKPAESLMQEVKKKFESLPNTAIDWKSLHAGPQHSRLDPNQVSLAGVFDLYFSHFSHCATSARLGYETFKSYPNYDYQPVKIVISDIPWFLIEKQRKLEEYDKLDGAPFWKQPFFLQS